MVHRLVAVVLVVGAFAIAGCNTVRGAAADVDSAATCTEELMKQGRC